MEHDPDFLVESIPNDLRGARQRGSRDILLPPIAPLLLTAVGTYICYAAAGLSLGLFLGGILWGGVLSGTFIAAEKTWLGRWAAGIGAVHGIAGVWLFASIKGNFPLGLWWLSYLSLTATVFAIGGIISLLRRMRCGPIGSGAIVTVVALAWLLWPIWLSPALHGERGDRIVSILVPANPMFAVNAILRERLGYWVEQSIAYHYTSLSDDVSYSLPHSVWWCVGWHGATGVITSLLSWRRGSSRGA